MLSAAACDSYYTGPTEQTCWKNSSVSRRQSMCCTSDTSDTNVIVYFHMLAEQPESFAESQAVSDAINSVGHVCDAFMNNLLLLACRGGDPMEPYRCADIS